MESTFFLIVLGVMLTAVLLLWMASPATQGARGERAVHGILKQSLNSSEYTVLRDVFLRVGRGTVQIDHIVVSPYGIFVIETQERGGGIYGAEKDDYWVHSFGHSRAEFPNPLRQNQAHLRALQELLGLKATKFHSLVVFTGKVEFMKPMPLHVITLDRLRPFFEVWTTQLLQPEETRRAVELIESSRLEPDAAMEPLPVQSLRTRQVASLPAAVTAPAAGRSVAPTRRREPGGRRWAVKALAGAASVAALLVAGNVLIGGLDGFRSIGGAWPTGESGRPAGVQDRQPASTTYEPSELRCGYSAEAMRCVCFDPEGGKVQMAFEECKALADEGAR